MPSALHRTTVASSISSSLQPQPVQLLPSSLINGSHQQRTARFKIWELQDCWHCMIIGTCLTLADVRQLVARTGCDVTHLSDYAVHRMAVERAANRSHQLTQRIQRLLDRKHQTRIRQFRPARDTQALQSLWSDGWRGGDVAGSLWALLTHPYSTRDLIHEVFGEVHMMSHLAGAKACGERERLLDQERRLSELEEELRRARRRQNEASVSLAEEVRKHDDTRREVNHLQARAQEARLRPGNDGVTTQGASNAEAVKSACETAERQCLAQLREKNTWLRQELDAAAEQEQRLQHDNDRLERLLARTLESRHAEDDVDELALCGRCVLYLGGKAGQCRHFQALVESCQGRFLHHDGGLENSGQRIAELVQQADAVLCPTDCISHSAMKKARRLCARQEKPMIFMQRASLSTFARSLAEVANQDVRLVTEK